MWTLVNINMSHYTREIWNSKYAKISYCHYFYKMIDYIEIEMTCYLSTLTTNRNIKICLIKTNPAFAGKIDSDCLILAKDDVACLRSQSFKIECLTYSSRKWGCCSTPNVSLCLLCNTMVHQTCCLGYGSSYWLLRVRNLEICLGWFSCVCGVLAYPIAGKFVHWLTFGPCLYNSLPDQLNDIPWHLQIEDTNDAD